MVGVGVVVGEGVVVLGLVDVVVDVVVDIKSNSGDNK